MGSDGFEKFRRITTKPKRNCERQEVSLAESDGTVDVSLIHALLHTKVPRVTSLKIVTKN